MKPSSPVLAQPLTPLDLLIGRQVMDGDGKPIGRIHEVRIDTKDGDWIVTHYVIGVGGLLERFGVGFKMLLGRSMSRYVVPVDQMDLSDRRHARVRRRRHELEAE